jgi:peptidoglycan/xylan/chitin deacetylase (PgdA/CDA1 family)
MISAKAVLRARAAQLLFDTDITLPKKRARGLFAVITFHRVLPEIERRQYPFPGLVVTPEELRALLRFLSAHFDCGSLGVQHDRYVNGSRVQRPLLAITFDDAPYDNFLYARPLLGEHGLKATFFAAVESVQRQELLWHDRLGFAAQALLHGDIAKRKTLIGLLTNAGIHAGLEPDPVGGAVQAAKRLRWAERLRLVDELVAASGSRDGPRFARTMSFVELVTLAAEGHEIGSHSMSHRLMPECGDDELLYEVAESRRLLEDEIRLPVTSFCFPNGNWDSRAVKALELAGYQRAVTTMWGYNGIHTNRYTMRRFDMDTRRMVNERGEVLPALIAFRMSDLWTRSA